MNFGGVFVEGGLAFGVFFQEIGQGFQIFLQVWVSQVAPAEGGEQSGKSSDDCGWEESAAIGGEEVVESCEEKAGCLLFW